jgi:hypothetical protein
VARNELRPVIKLRSTAGTGCTCVTRKNRRNHPDRLTSASTTRSSAGTSCSARNADPDSTYSLWRAVSCRNPGTRARREAAAKTAASPASMPNSDGPGRAMPEVINSAVAAAGA